jgi:hypothetical protein
VHHLATAALRRNVVEIDEEHVFASPMLCDLEEIADAGEAAFAGEARRDLFERDRDDGIDFNLAFFEAVSSARTNTRMHPDPNAFRDRTASHAVAQVFREQHRGSLTRCLSALARPGNRALGKYEEEHHPDEWPDAGDGQGDLCGLLQDRSISLVASRPAMLG